MRIKDKVFQNTVFQMVTIKNNIIDLGINSNGFGHGNTLNSLGKSLSQSVRML